MIQIITGDSREVLRTLPDQSVHCCVTSPPYFGLRDYGVDGQMGLEPTPAEYVEGMVAVFREVRRVLRDDGTLWLNLGDSYAGTGKTGGGAQGAKLGAGAAGATSSNGSGSWWSPKGTDLKVKDLIGIPWRVAFALQADGWHLRSSIIWHKPNPMPESVADRPTNAHENIFLLSKSPRYFYDAEAVREAASDNPVTRARNGRSDKGVVGASALHGTGIGQSGNGGFVRGGDTRNLRNVWLIPTQPFSEAHFATMAPALAETCIKAGCPEGGTVLDPFGGAGTTGLVADRLRRNALLIELNPDYVAIAKKRIEGDSPLLAEVAS